VEAEAKKCSLACAKAAGSDDRLPCDRPETSWSKSVEEATVADTAVAGGRGGKKVLIVDKYAVREYLVRCY
jgi:hypothetical protein